MVIFLCSSHIYFLPLISISLGFSFILSFFIPFTAPLSFHRFVRFVRRPPVYFQVTVYHRAIERLMIIYKVRKPAVVPGHCSGSGQLRNSCQHRFHQFALCKFGDVFNTRKSTDIALFPKGLSQWFKIRTFK